MILCLETATPTCSVALIDEGKVLALRECVGQNAHSEKITVFISEVMKEAGIGYERLDAVAVSKGPGSYTGLRIGVSTAKGVCYAADKPMMAIDTLQAMACGFVGKHQDSVQSGDLLIPMIDARRMEVYCSVFDSAVDRVADTAALVIDADSFSDLLKEHHLWLFGDGAAKCGRVFADNGNVNIIDGFVPSAAYMASLADKALKDKNFVNLAYFEPFYLKDFVAGKPHVKGL